MDKLDNEQQGNGEHQVNTNTEQQINVEEHKESVTANTNNTNNENSIASTSVPTQSDTPVEKQEIELTLEDVFVNLRLISKIEVGDKLIQTDKYVNIDTSFLKFFTRWYYGTNRNNTLGFINVVLLKAFEINSKLLEEKTDESVQILLRLTTDMKNSVNGLINLKHTYSSDKLIQSEIDVMIDNIRSKLDLNSKNLNFNKPTISVATATTVAPISASVDTDKQNTTSDVSLTNSSNTSNQTNTSNTIPDKPVKNTKSENVESSGKYKQSKPYSTDFSYNVDNIERGNSKKY